MVAAIIAALAFAGQLFAFGFEVWKRFNDKSIEINKKKDSAQKLMDVDTQKGDIDAFLDHRSDKYSSD